MKRLKLVSLTLMVCLLPWSAHAELSGLDIESNSQKIMKPEFDYREIDMVLIDKGGSEQARTMRSYKRTDGGLDKNLLVFDTPSGIRGVASLTWEQSGEDNQWLYLPAQKSLKMISGGGKRNYFMGTDIAYEDMTAQNLDEYEYKRQPDETLDGKTVYVVDMYPMADDVKRNTGYQFQRRYYNPENFFIVRIDYYDKRGQLLKRSTAVKIHPAKNNPNIYVADETMVENFSNGHKTKSILKDYSFEESKVPSSVFDKRNITSGKYMRDAG